MDDEDDNSRNTASEGRKRPRSRNDDAPSSACDQCRYRKIKCDRLQPKCSSCRKTDIACTSSGTVKRVNQTKQLRDDFTTVLERLDGVDQTLSALTKITEQLAARTFSSNSNTSPPTSSLSQPTQISGNDEGSAILPSAQRDRPGRVAEDGCRHETIRLSQGGERIYSYPAAIPLLISLSKQLSQVLVEHGSEQDGSVDAIVKDPALRIALRRQLQNFPFPRCQQPVVASDHKPMTTPPRFLVDLFVNNFLRNINIRFPIFDETLLYRAIDSYYSGESSGDSGAWTSIFNNIVLLGLGLEVQVVEATQSNTRNMNNDLLPSFLQNCDRALANLDSFTCPSIINVQALIVLALTSKQFYGNIMFERICQTACQVGLTLGLHRSRTSEDDAGHEQTEWERLFRVLYALDKQRAFMSGQTCDLHLFDSDLTLSSISDNELPSRRLNNAFDHMMEIWEEIYLSLYSSRANTAGEAYRVRQARRMTQLVDEWNQQNHELIAATLPEDIAGLANVQLELNYCYHVTQVLCLRHDRRDEPAQHQMRNHARICLRLISEAGSPSLTTASLALLDRMLGNYPVVAFVELVAFYFNTLAKGEVPEPELEADLEILWAICRYLQALHNPSFQATYYPRLRDGLTWALENIEIMKTKPVGQSQGPLDYIDISPLDLRCPNSFFIPATTSSPEGNPISTSSPANITREPSNIPLMRLPEDGRIALGQSTIDLTSFDFCTTAPPSTSLDGPGLQSYSVPSHSEYNPTSDLFQLFTTEE
ncbi:hypothetical protein F5Y00DRAFT_271257 [Daldinia vernicosa]|uniref:uncharacterized protein n=1 Tax=Daldinia vernicosa TaxID=114800 RepID=UPI002007F0B5|nr:uncharacterized protein F5Y00DRAFT_271257 [Daldinia vernicosa]KAI0847319.1 hypothetical protein F5Y00DRAFT_271257 [Daldinia vernicosa]